MGEWNSGLKINDFKQKMHTVLLNGMHIVKILIFPIRVYQFDSMQINILTELCYLTHFILEFI